MGLVALAGLLGLTSWVVASVSTWLVPVYVTAMVFIFVSPRVESPEGSRGAGDTRQPAAGEEPARGARSPSRKVPPPSQAAEPSAGGSPEASAEGISPSPPGPAAAKPRRRRARKPAKPGSEPAVAAPQATWIRVGPGKFVRADLHAQGVEAEAPSQPTSEVEPSQAPTPDEAFPQDSPEAAVPIEEPAQADAPLEAGPIEPGPSPEVSAPTEEPVAMADPVSDPPIDADQEPRADEAREESSPPELSGSNAIDEDIPADPPDPDPVPEEYGIAPSAFDPDPPADPTDWDDRDPDPAGTADPLDPGAEDLADAAIENEAECEVGIEAGPDSPPVPEQVWAGDPGLTPAASGPLSAPAEVSPGADLDHELDGESARGGVAGNRSFLGRLAPRPLQARIPGPPAGPGVSRLARNLRPGRHRGRRGLARPWSGANPRPRASTRRSHDRPVRISRGFHARSPPSRS